MSRRRSTPRDGFISRRFWRDSGGNVVVAQRPNLLLGLWLTTSVAVRLIAAGRVKTGLGATADALLFAWAYLEATHGVNYFRRLLGVTVLLLVVTGFFRT